jgi:succinate dehydrogenase hydrophobic anchor subunit
MQKNVPLSQRGFTFDTFMWLFTRLSALVMYLLTIIGLVGALIMGARTQMNLADLIRWTFMPNSTHILNTDVPDLAPWTTIFWKWMGSTFIIFATSHGLHGLLSIIEDYLSHAWVRRFLRILVLLLTLVMCGIGIYIIWTS